MMMETIYKFRTSTKLFLLLVFMVVSLSLYLRINKDSSVAFDKKEISKESEESVLRIYTEEVLTTTYAYAEPERVIEENNSSSLSDVFKRVKELTNCSDSPREHKMVQWGPYWVLSDFVPAKKTYKCEESVTFATVATYNFLENILPIVNTWDGPVSVAVYAPGSDFNLALESIAYLRECKNSVVAEIVSFHLFFEMIYFPDEILTYENFLSKKVINCSESAPYETYKFGQSFREKRNAFFMVNVARNIARKFSTTHFILIADVEMYPSANIPTQFLKMISNEDPETYSKQLTVYAIFAFEVRDWEKPPLNKKELRLMLNKKSAQQFHFNLCGKCHNFPHFESWLSIDKKEMEITERVKRTGNLAAWEPFFIGTNLDPWYDERVSWEGMRDKRIQAFALCLLGYNFSITSDGFLVHKPGYKKTEYFGNRYKQSKATERAIDVTYVPQYKKLYGNNPSCTI